ncbi:beta-ketoacyl-ACP synthase II [Halarsenatibacter silvermanii]|uniref:3-oxoacyl-[acyl-carrier-protein] synthase 2 n=1 Tax=Halarsenatibacter silvermanii TaxID=321763 RepID=A0A1G9NV63_9FIRM|nr:beta-ketoacyl-ACP synthase II [Halarsenatibacter silvermanii]SDL89875.1 3-oxoacyl-[acyl-carrier-protein] synthase II [Halarsenatibacter silvermanii]
MSNDRVVVTGMGVLTSLGDSLEEFWQGIIAGESGIDKIESIDDVEKYPSQIGSEVKDFNPDCYIDKKSRKRMALFTQYGVYSALEALEDADLEIEENIAEETGVIVGSGIGGIEVIEEQITRLNQRGPKRVSPFFIPMMISNMCAGQISIYAGAKGPNSNTVTACASATHAIGDAMEVIKRGDARVMIAGGTEASISPSALAGFGNMKALSTRNDEPKKASRPFDDERDGFVIGEGSGMLILEDYEHAKNRGADIYCEISGYGSTADAYHITQPDPEGEGAARAMEAAVEKSSVSSEDIDYINAHGTSTPFNDKLETKAIKKVFSDRAYDLSISSSKSMIGHLLGAAGAVESIISIKAINTGLLPPTINYENPDPECDLDYIPNEHKEVGEVKAVMTNSFGFGGHNACLVLNRL